MAGAEGERGLDLDADGVGRHPCAVCRRAGGEVSRCNQYLSKGSKVLVEGRLSADPNTGGPRVWTGQDGSTRASFEITAQTVRFLSSRGEIPTGGGAEGGMMDAGDMLPAEDDIPF